MWRPRRDRSAAAPARSRSLAAALLATTSIAALVAGGSGPARADGCGGGDIPNPSGGFTNPAGAMLKCIQANGVTVTGNIVNAGIISPGSGFGIQINDGTVNGSVINSGTISVAGTGIRVSIPTFSGSISNSGTITAATGIEVSGGGLGQFPGGITNSGRIAAANVGIFVTSIAIFGSPGSFSGGMTNTGTIVVGSGTGIFINSMTTFAGGVTNAGTIVAQDQGIGVNAVTVFSGGISNAGLISADQGVFVRGIQTFTGGILNTGSIAAQSRGIFVAAIGLFSGGVTNRGTIAGDIGIDVVGVSTFSGDISNAGTISASGVAGVHIGGTFSTVPVATFSGGISNSGTILAGNGVGILVGFTISEPATAVVTTFTGGITNSGTISALTGILYLGGSTFSGAIANSGTITGTGGTAIDVSEAPNAMTINQMAGTITGAIKLSPFADVLNITGGTINGNIVGHAGAASTINFALGAGTFTYASPFSITNVNQIKVTSGLVILDGTNSATNVAINGGTLEVGDAGSPGAVLTATSAFTVGASGTLAGHGTVAANIAIPAGATLAPGGSIGTFSVDGSLSLAAGSFYAIEVNGSGAGSKTTVTGAAAISGGTVKVSEDPGVYAFPTRYTILAANGGVAGTFAGATSSFGIFIPTLTYDPDDVFLTLSRNPTYFQSLAQTANQHAVGAALDASPFGSTLVQTLAFASPSIAPQAYDALSGEVHASTQSVLIDDSRYLRQAVLGRLRQADYAAAPGPLGALGFAGPDHTETAAPDPAAGSASSSDAGLARSYDASRAFPLKALPLKAPPALPYLTFWSQAVGAWGQIEGDGNAAGVRRDLGGFFSGVDARFGDLVRLGFVTGFSRSSVTDSPRDSSAGIDTAHVGVYAGSSAGPFSLRAGGAYAFHTIDTSRAIIFPGFFDSARARYDGGTGQIFGEAGYGLAFGNVAAEPFAGLSWVHLQTDGFSETGGAAALAGAGSHDDVGYATLGARAATSYLLANGWTLIPRASAAWQHAFGDTTPSAALAFQSTGIGFSVAGVPLAQDAALVEAGLDLRIAPHARLGLSYSGELAARLQDHAVKGNFTWNF